MRFNVSNLLSTIVLVSALSLLTGMPLVPPVSATPLPRQAELKRLPTGMQPVIHPSRLEKDEMPQPLRRGIVFRVISSGGLAGQTIQTLLLSDGRILQTRVLPNGRYSSQQVDRISLQAVNQFRQLLKRTSFDRYDRLSYAPTPGAADFITVTLSSPSGTVQYADSVLNQLPPAIQAVITAWSKL